MEPVNMKVYDYEQLKNYCSLHKFPKDEEICNQWIRAIGDEEFLFANDKVLHNIQNECCCDFADDDYHAYVSNFCSGTNSTLFNEEAQLTHDENMKIFSSDSSSTKANSEVGFTSPLKEKFIENSVFQGQQFLTTEKQDFRLSFNTKDYEKKLSLDDININYNFNGWNFSEDDLTASRSAFVNTSLPMGNIKEYFNMDTRTIERFPSELSPKKKSASETYKETETCNPYKDQIDFDPKSDASFQQMNEEVYVENQWNQLETGYFKSAGILEQLRKLEQFCYAMKPSIVQAILSEINSLLSRYDKLDNYEQRF